MKSMSIYWPVDTTKIVHERGVGQTMQVIERRVKVVVGLNDMARKLGCSRGHLSLVIHGKRDSRRLMARLLTEHGYKPGSKVIVEHGTARVRKARAS